LSRGRGAERFRAYRALNATVFVPTGVDLCLEWRAAVVASEMDGEELSQKYDILLELLRREFEGDYSPNFKRALEDARRGGGPSYVWDVVRWEREGLSDRDIMGRVVAIIAELAQNLSADRYREGVLLVLCSKTAEEGPNLQYVLSLSEDSNLFSEWRSASETSEEVSMRLNESLGLLLRLLTEEPEGRCPSAREAINAALSAISEMIQNLSESRFREGALFMLYRLSDGGYYALSARDCIKNGSQDSVRNADS